MGNTAPEDVVVSAGLAALDGPADADILGAFRARLPGGCTLHLTSDALIALMGAVGILRASGFLDFLASLVGRLPIGKILPGELFPLILVRLFSSSAATGAALDLFKTYGTDSYLGMCTSLLLSSTETVFYTMSVYFLTAKVAKTRWTLPGALISTGAGVAASIILAGMISG